MLFCKVQLIPANFEPNTVTMNTFISLKISLAFSLMALYSIPIMAQECSVELATIKGTYTGDCKKGKASGKGKSVGFDTYEGEFKSGLPDGKGTYSWQNGNVYTGKFSKGLRDGQGTMTIKRTGTEDSIVQGFWKKDVYIGKYEKPYVVHGKTGSVRDVEIEYNKDDHRRVRIIVVNTTGGVQKMGGVMPKFQVDNVQVLVGNYERLTTLETHLKATESSLMEVNFPFRAKIKIGTEEIEIELLETGSYTINVSINQ